METGRSQNNQATATTQIGIAALICGIIAVLFDEWQFTYAGGLFGTYLCCAQEKQLPCLWPTAIATLAICLTRSKYIAHCSAGALGIAGMTLALLDHFLKPTPRKN